jgi:hypothetical protein
MLIKVPITASEPSAVNTTSQSCESSRVWPSWAATSATSVTVDARRGSPVNPAIAAD